ncbi:hypothetical protein RRG08_064801 [Elysia crispata]|uniref:Uncharacterized protein n=1 Tax=Elysia crispata TaxID=231223 RepID=A0AAE1D4G8_9GAST|nr:hypothetical protein RRG08_064801 [Elysia crispata]
MSIAALGRIEEFYPAQNDLDSYLERLEQYFVANDVMEAKRTAVLLSVIGLKTYELPKSLVAPDKPSAKSYPDLKAVLLSHFKKKMKQGTRGCGLPDRPRLQSQLLNHNKR